MIRSRQTGDDGDHLAGGQLTEERKVIASCILGRRQRQTFARLTGHPFAFRRHLLAPSPVAFRRHLLAPVTVARLITWQGVDRQPLSPEGVDLAER